MSERKGAGNEARSKTEIKQQRRKYKTAKKEIEKGSEQTKQEKTKKEGKIYRKEEMKE